MSRWARSPSRRPPRERVRLIGAGRPRDAERARCPSCSPKGGTLMPTVNEAEIRRHLDAMARGDAAELAEILADDFVQERPQSGERIRGVQACLAVAQA